MEGPAWSQKQKPQLRVVNTQLWVVEQRVECSRRRCKRHHRWNASRSESRRCELHPPLLVSGQSISWRLHRCCGLHRSNRCTCKRCVRAVVRCVVPVRVRCENRRELRHHFAWLRNRERERERDDNSDSRDNTINPIRQTVDRERVHNVTAQVCKWMVIGMQLPDMVLYARLATLASQPSPGRSRLLRRDLHRL